MPWLLQKPDYNSKISRHFVRSKSIYHWRFQWTMCLYGCCSNICVCQPGQATWHLKGCLIDCIFLLHSFVILYSMSSSQRVCLPGRSSWVDNSGFTSHRSCCCLLQQISLPAEPPSFLLVLDCKNHFSISCLFYWIIDEAGNCDTKSYN